LHVKFELKHPGNAEAPVPRGSQRPHAVP